MGLAFGLDRKALRLDDSFVSAAALEVGTP
jgi:hypothetical protein